MNCWRNNPTNNTGSAIINVLIAMGITSIIITSIMNMLDTSYRTIRYINEKSAAMDFKKELSLTLQDGTICSQLLTQSGLWISQPTPITFDISTIGTSSPPTIDLNHIPTSTALGAALIIKVGNPISSSQPTLVVDRIVIQDIIGSGPIFDAVFLVSFDQDRLSRPLRPVVVKTKILTSGTGSTKTVSSCKSEITLQAQLHTKVITANSSFSVPNNVTKLRVTVIGSGGGGAGGVGANSQMGEHSCTGGGAGGGGGTAICSINVNEGDSFSVSIGSGGAPGTGGANSGTNGLPGEQSSFGSICIASGGQGGEFGVPNPLFGLTTGAGGGNGGIGLTGTTLVPGSNGGVGFYGAWCFEKGQYATSQGGGASYGGSNIFGGGGTGGIGGGSYGSSGQKGQKGVVYIEWVE